MRDVDDYMDDLFKKAADSYPLKTVPSDWDAVLSMLNNESEVYAGSPKRGVELLMKGLFIILLFFVFYKTGDVYLLKNNHYKIPFTQQNIKTFLPDKKILIAESAFKKNAKKQNYGNYSPTLNGHTIKIFKPDIEEIKYHTPGDFAKGSTKAYAGDIGKSTHVYGSYLPTMPLAQENEKNTEATKDTTPLSTNELKKIIKTDSISDLALAKINNHAPKFYVGLTLGAQFNQVKNQGNTSPGLSIGLVGGLKLNNKLTMETGIQLTQKKYYSSGIYFHPKENTMPDNMVVNSLNGKLILIEVPLNLKYNFIDHRNKVYGLAGISSYLMMKERNKYAAEVSGQPMEMNITYPNRKSYFASVVNLSVGYQYFLNHTALRIEPYLQLPLRGMGVGSMNMTTTGVHLILTRE